MQKTIRLFRDIYRMSVLKIEIEGRSLEFKVRNGVKQGHVASPILFTGVLQIIIQNKE